MKQQKTLYFTSNISFGSFLLQGAWVKRVTGGICTVNWGCFHRQLTGISSAESSFLQLTDSGLNALKIYWEQGDPQEVVSLDLIWNFISEVVLAKKKFSVLSNWMVHTKLNIGRKAGRTT